MRIVLAGLVLSLLLSGCAGQWSDYNYGPGDWLNDNTALTVDTMYNYAHLAAPTIEIHHVDSVADHCGTTWALGCAVVKDGHCDIYVGNVVSPAVLAHEERHCRGWSHYRPRFEMFAAMGKEFQARELERAGRGWFPTKNTLSATAMARTAGR